MTVDTSLAVAGGVSDRGKSPTGRGVGGVPLAALERGEVWPFEVGVLGEGGASGRMTVGGIGRDEIVCGLGFVVVCCDAWLFVGGCCAGVVCIVRVGFVVIG